MASSTQAYNELEKALGGEKRRQQRSSGNGNERPMKE